ncbi:hypothetical protein F2Q69_00008405 [Brassica cretica]|uniref:Uncharacterized protein n=1 Tax=Brassica cretica TaxID=69181 RepID=A0A8S9PFB6_BRACR|nr:hypothetical protein F2Q69_00008405 [Brassica cretica]
MSTFISSPPFFLNGRGSEVDSGYASSLTKVVTYVATKTVLGLKRRAAPSRKHSLGQSGFSSLQTLASDKACSTCPNCNQQRLRLRRRYDLWGQTNGRASMGIWNASCPLAFASVPFPFASIPERVPKCPCMLISMSIHIVVNDLVSTVKGFAPTNIIKKPRFKWIISIPERVPKFPCILTYMSIQIVVNDLVSTVKGFAATNIIKKPRFKWIISIPERVPKFPCILTYMSIQIVVNDLVSTVKGFAATNLIGIAKLIEFSFFNEGLESV